MDKELKEYKISGSENCSLKFVVEKSTGLKSESTSHHNQIRKDQCMRHYETQKSLTSSLCIWYFSIRTSFKLQNFRRSMFLSLPSLVKYSRLCLPEEHTDLGILPRSSIIWAKWSSSREKCFPDLGSNKKSPVTNSNTRHAIDHMSTDVSYSSPRMIWIDIIQKNKCRIYDANLVECWGHKSRPDQNRVSVSRRKPPLLLLARYNDGCIHTQECSLDTNWPNVLIELIMK